MGGRPPFEEVALQLVEAGDPDALAIFLKTKLQVCDCYLSCPGSLRFLIPWIPV